jgi:hydroxymethylbilane synthase
LRRLRIGSRGSALALWQAEYVARRLREERSVDTEIVVIKTSGDRFQAAPIPALGLKGVFIREIEDALLDKRVDLAVHSLKDIPTEVSGEFTFPAFCERQDPRDCLVSSRQVRLAGLPAGSRIGTSSLRRRAQLLYVRPDLVVEDLRGNVDTRLRKLETGRFDAIVLAKAGLERLGQSGRITEVLAPEVCLPAAGQGAIVVETLAASDEVIHNVSALDHPLTRKCAGAERALLAALQGGCQVPVGAWARREGDCLAMEAAVLAPDGSECIRGSASGQPEEAEKLGQRLAEELLARGAGRLLALAGRHADGG